jgi:hypothetical protein
MCRSTGMSNEINSVAPEARWLREAVRRLNSLDQWATLSSSHCIAVDPRRGSGQVELLLVVSTDSTIRQALGVPAIERTAKGRKLPNKNKGLLGPLGIARFDLAEETC